jgi:hypothetical protein
MSSIRVLFLLIVLSAFAATGIKGRPAGSTVASTSPNAIRPKRVPPTPTPRPELSRDDKLMHNSVLRELLARGEQIPGAQFEDFADSKPSTPAEQQAAATHLASARTQFGAYRDPDTVATAELVTNATRMLAAKDYRGLETLSANLRFTKARFASGAWKITTFYDCISRPSGKGEEGWLRHGEQLHHWVAAAPKSVTAHIAYAEFLCSHAWEARGGDWATNVPKEGYRLFTERLKQAFSVLSAAGRLPQKDVHWWRVAQTVALGLGMERTAYDNMVNEGIRFEPDYYEFYVAKALFLLPRWYGKMGEWERYTDEVRQQSPQGPEIYARIISGLAFALDGVLERSWDSTSDGFTRLFQRWPQSTTLVYDYLRLCQLHEDRSAARTALERMGNRLDSQLWGNEQRFLAVYNWAYRLVAAR